MKPRVIGRRANQQVAIPVVGPVAVDVVNMFAFPKRPSESLFSNYQVLWFGSAPSIRPWNTLSPIKIATNASAEMPLSESHIGAGFTALMMDNLQSSTVWAWIQRLPMFIARQSDPFFALVIAWTTFLEARCLTYVQQMVPLLLGHRNGILLHGGGIAKRLA